MDKFPAYYQRVTPRSDKHRKDSTAGHKEDQRSRADKLTSPSKSNPNSISNRVIKIKINERQLNQQPGPFSHASTPILPIN